MKILLKRDGVNPDKPDKNDRTSLWWAADNRDKGVVKTLPGRKDINPDKSDNHDRTQLWYAANSVTNLTKQGRFHMTNSY